MAANSDRSPVDDVCADADKEVRMLLNPPTDSVQLTSTNQSRDPTNGQVLLTPVGHSATSSSVRTGVGMTKQELMKYANDPFWVRLRTFLFILFWVIWFAMLIGSVVIVAMAPGCPATASLPWWKKSSMMDITVGDIPKADRASYAQQLKEKLSNVKSSLNELTKMNVNTIIVGSFDPYILISSPSDDNRTRDQIDELRSEITSLAKNEEQVKVIVGLNLQQTPDSFHWYNKSQTNQTDFQNVYIWSTDKPKLDRYKYDVDRLQYVALGSNDNPLLNYASEQVRDLMRDAVLAWMKTKVEGIQTAAVWSQNEPNGDINKSKEADLDLLKAVKSAGQNKVLLNTDQELSEDAFEEGEEQASFDMAPDPTFWKKLTEQFKMKESFENIFSRYVKQEQQQMSEANKTNSDILVNRENVGKHWRSYQMQHPSDEQNPILRESNLAMSEAAAMAMFMIPRVTPIIQLDLSAPNADITAMNNKSSVIDRMFKLRKDNVETFLAGRTVMPDVKGSSSVLAIYRAAKRDNGYLLLVNEADSQQTISIDMAQLPYQEEVISRRVIMVNSDSSKDSVGIDVNMEQIKLDAKQSMLIEFSVN